MSNRSEYSANMSLAQQNFSPIVIGKFFIAPAARREHHAEVMRRRQIRIDRIKARIRNTISAIFLGAVIGGPAVAAVFLR